MVFYFYYQKMTYDTDWYQVEDQIASQLFVNKNEMNIIESIGDSLLSIYDFKCGNPGVRGKKLVTLKDIILIKYINY